MGILGITIGIIEDTIASIKREYVEHNKYPEWKRETFIRFYLKKQRKLSDILYPEDIAEETIPVPGIWMSIISQIAVNIVIYPLLVLWAIWSGPIRAYKQFNNFIRLQLRLQAT